MDAARIYGDGKWAVVDPDDGTVWRFREHADAEAEKERLMKRWPGVYVQIHRCPDSWK